MKWAKPIRIHIIGFMGLMPLISFALMYIQYGQRLWSEWGIWITGILVMYIFAWPAWRMLIQSDHLLHKRFPTLQQTAKRVVLKILINILVMALAITVVMYFHQAVNLWGYRVTATDLKYGLLVGAGVILLFDPLLEVIYILQQYRAAAAEEQRLIQLQLSQEFGYLKQKVNPHFLFNCFNTLSSLISEDKQRAEAFLDEMSKVYRYLLRSNEDGLSTLENELKFIQSYFGLLKTRHGEAVQLQLGVDKQYYPYLLPSLSLQMLVENVVKHNALSKNKPLSIDIFTTVGNKLVVNNNLQRRSVKPAGGRVGLDNIRAKYQLLNQPGFQVMEDEKNFTVVLPLIWNSKSGFEQIKNS
ncbi:MAG: histidine kinase [Dinghuibacter sp.]|nr:histidine kinase [Dinghuibacter sp.]